MIEKITINPQAMRWSSLYTRHENSRLDVLDLFAAGLTAEQILEEMPDLEADDLRAALIYASRKLDHSVLVA